MNRIAASFLSVLMLASVSTTARAAWQTPSVPTEVVAEQSEAPAPNLTATIRDPYYKITAQDVSDAIASQLSLQGVVTKAEVIMSPGTPATLYATDHAVKLVIHTLQIDPQAKRWQAQAYFVADNKTESVHPISGTYGAMIDVPMLARQFSRTDVIAAEDIHMTAVPERLLRKDTITDTKQLIGQSPRVGISPNRPIRVSEVSAPIVIKKGDLVEMRYTTPYIHIKTTGIALEDGAKGSAIRVKNQKSERAVSAHVESAGVVQVNNEAAL
jgi:flagella basal body P-ring formation protein FlgA